MTFNIGDRVRFIGPRLEQEYMLGWEGEILSNISPLGNTYHVRLENPDNLTTTHLEWYSPYRFELVSAGSSFNPILNPIERTIHQLQKRQKFYQDNKKQLPTWFASFGD